MIWKMICKPELLGEFGEVPPTNEPPFLGVRLAQVTYIWDLSVNSNEDLRIWKEHGRKTRFRILIAEFSSFRLDFEAWLYYIWEEPTLGGPFHHSPDSKCLREIASM